MEANATARISHNMELGSNVSTAPAELFHAYRVHPAGLPLTPAPIDRDWMDATPDRFAYRCLPLVIANQAGWVIPSALTPMK